MAEYLTVEIVTPQKRRVYEQAVSCSAPGVSGNFQILVNHTDFMSQLDIGELKITTADSQNLEFALSGGFLEVKDNRILLLLESFEAPDEIDVERAQKALERARQRLRENPPGTDLERARIAMARAMNRLRVAKKVLISQN